MGLEVSLHICKGGIDLNVKCHITRFTVCYCHHCVEIPLMMRSKRINGYHLFMISISFYH